MSKVLITETVLRDSHQSLAATRMTIDEMTPILDDLDKTRQLRNYVYHHNMLYSLGKSELESSIQRVLINLPNQELKLFYLKKINSLSLKGDEKNKELYSKIKVNITL